MIMNNKYIEMFVDWLYEYMKNVVERLNNHFLDKTQIDQVLIIDQLVKA